MNLIDQATDTINFIILLTVLLGGGITSYFILKNRVASFWKNEAEAYKESVERLEKEMDWMKKELIDIRGQNQRLLTERNYLKSIIIEALTSQKTVAKDLLEHLEKEIKSEVK